VKRPNGLLSILFYDRGFQTVGRASLRGGGGSCVGEASCLHEGHIFRRKYGCKIKYIFYCQFVSFKYFACHSVPVLTPNCKQHILSSA
jgi:hypothetical protein